MKAMRISGDLLDFSESINIETLVSMQDRPKCRFDKIDNFFLMIYVGTGIVGLHFSINRVSDRISNL